MIFLLLSFTFSMANTQNTLALGETNNRMDSVVVMEKLLTNFLLILYCPFYFVCLLTCLFNSFCESHYTMHHHHLADNVVCWMRVCARVCVILFAIKLFVRRRFIYIVCFRIFVSLLHFQSLSFSLVQFNRKSYANTTVSKMRLLHLFWLSLFAILGQISAMRDFSKKHTVITHFVIFI